MRTFPAEGMPPAHTVTVCLTPACHHSSRVCRESTDLPVPGWEPWWGDSKQSWLGSLQLELQGKAWRPRGPDWPSQVAGVSLLFFSQSFGSALGLIHLAHSTYSSVTWPLKLAWEFIFFFSFTRRNLNLWFLVHCPFLSVTPPHTPLCLHLPTRYNSFLPG